MARVGRPPALDEMKQREICAIISVGCSRQTAASYVGCASDTIRKTAQRDAGFNDQLQQAESKYEILHLKNINEAAKSKQYWRAAAWALERKFPDRYGHRHPTSITAEQVSNLVAQLAEIVAEAVPAAKHRKAVLRRITALLEVLGSEDEPDGK